MRMATRRLNIDAGSRYITRIYLFGMIEQLENRRHQAGHTIPPSIYTYGIASRRSSARRHAVYT